NTPTITGTRPTFTRTPLVTNTPTITLTPCNNNNYIYSTATGTVVPGVDDTGNHGDDVVTQINLAFPFTLYGVFYSTANVSSNGNLQFTSSNSAFTNDCLPTASMNATIFPHWDALRT